ncbi:unnamed protein product [Urochloa humidicola]
MEYDFRGRPGSGSYGAPPGSAPGGGGGSSLYPRVGQPSHGGGGAGTASPRAAPYHHGSGAGSGTSAPIVTPLAPTSSASSKVGIQVMIKPEFRITPPPQLPPQMVEIPRSTFNFDFECERRILAEAEKENPNWSKFVVERQAPPPVPQPQPQQARPASSGSGDPVVDKYVSMGLGREAVSFAVLNYGDNPAKVKEFVKSYNILHEMGFTSPNVPELLAIHDNDPDKVIQRLLSSPS